MCRIAYINNEILNKIEVGVLSDYFVSLEKSQGGHGNGVAFFHKKHPLLLKGVKLPAPDCAKYVKSHDKIRNGILFHTRFATAGARNDEMAQPFIVQGNIYAHNGDERNYKIIKIILNRQGIQIPPDSSDSKIFSILASRYGIDILKKTDSNWAVLTKQGLWASGNFDALVQSNKRILMLGSELSYWKDLISGPDIEFIRIVADGTDFSKTGPIFSYKNIYTSFLGNVKSCGMCGDDINTFGNHNAKQNLCISCEIGMENYSDTELKKSTIRCLRCKYPADFCICDEENNE